MPARQFWFLCTALLAGASEVVFLAPNSLTAMVSGLSMLLLTASITLIVLRSREGNRWPFIALPLALVVSAGSVIVLVSDATIRGLILGIVSLSVGVCADAILATKKKTATTHTSDNRLLYTLGHLALLTVFFTTSGMAALGTYFSLPSALMIVVFTWMIYISGRGFTTSVPQLENRERWSVIVLLVVAMVQVFIAFIALPFHFIVIGGLVGIIFYSLSGILRTATLGLLNRTIIIRYMIGAIISIAIVLATAQWI